jgi:hypothetical protein
LASKLGRFLRNSGAVDFDTVSQAFPPTDKLEQMKDMRKLLAFLFRQRKSKSADPSSGKGGWDAVP